MLNYFTNQSRVKKRREEHRFLKRNSRKKSGPFDPVRADSWPRSRDDRGPRSHDDCGPRSHDLAFSRHPILISTSRWVHVSLLLGDPRSRDHWISTVRSPLVSPVRWRSDAPDVSTLPINSGHDPSSSTCFTRPMKIGRSRCLHASTRSFTHDLISTVEFHLRDQRLRILHVFWWRFGWTPGPYDRRTLFDAIASNTRDATTCLARVRFRGNIVPHGEDGGESRVYKVGQLNAFVLPPQNPNQSPLTRGPSKCQPLHSPRGALSGIRVDSRGPYHASAPPVRHLRAVWAGAALPCGLVCRVASARVLRATCPPRVLRKIKPFLRF